MKILNAISTISLLTAAALAAHAAAMLSVTNMNALQGLAPVTALGNTDTGKAALASNFTITGDIQSGAAKQPLLLSFPGQQQQALRDDFITTVAYELADGLGNKLGDAYRTEATNNPPSAGDCKALKFTSILPAVDRLIRFANATSYSDSNAGKYFFANETLNGKEPVSVEAKAILTDLNGIINVFGNAYKPLVDSPNADRCGATEDDPCNPRPFQTEPNFAMYHGRNFCASETTNSDTLEYLKASPAYPSGHTTYGYMESLLLALLVPERYQQMVTRAAEYGNDRIVLGAHYAMDVVAGRTLAEYDLAQLLANKAGYVGVKPNVGVKPEDLEVIDDFREALAAARADLTAALKKGCGGEIADCAAQDESRFADPAMDKVFYEATQTYGLPVVFANNAQGTEDVAKLAPEAGYLLTAAFPSLTLAQADAILTLTEGPGGGFLDNGSAFGVYSRLDLYRAAEQAAALSANGK
jgi:PAP2 superfamily